MKETPTFSEPSALDDTNGKCAVKIKKNWKEREREREREREKRWLWNAATDLFR